MLYFSYFKSDDESMYIAKSEDGLNWNGPERVLESTVGSKSIRDPFIIEDNVGLYHMLASDGWSSTSVLHSVSNDLKAWNDPELLPVMKNIDGAQNAWAPECIYDSNTDAYVVFWSSTVRKRRFSRKNNHRIWAVTTKDFVEYSEAFILFDPGYSVIDATMINFGGRILMAFKDERGMTNELTGHKGIQIATADSALGLLR